MEPDELFIEDLKIRNKQKYINKMFEEEGLTDSILRQQLELNKKRNEMNIPDKSEIVNEDEKGGYVQWLIWKVWKYRQEW